MSDAVGFIEGDNQEPVIGSEVKIITDRITKAQTSYRLARDAALETVGHIVLIWQEVLSKAAKKDTTQWYKEQITLRNEFIAIHNDEIGALYQRARDFMDGKLKEEDPINQKPSNEDHRALLEEQKENLRELSSHTREQRYAQKLVKYFPDDDQKTILDLVKFVLNLETPADSDIASRYAAVTQWVIDQNHPLPFPDILLVVDILKQGGGFEVVLAKQRALKNEGADNADQSILKADIQSQAKILVRGMDAKSTIDLHSQLAQDGYVLLLARTNGGQADILGEVPTTENEINSAILHISDHIKDPATPHCEFLARAVALGSIVAEGDDGGMTRDRTQSGEAVKSQRAMVVRPGADGHAMLVVSGQYVDSSPVIHAWPTQWPEFDEIKQDVILPRQHLKSMERDLSNLIRRRRIEIDLDLSPKRANQKDASSPAAFQVVYNALEEKGRSSARQQFFLNLMGNVTHKPVDTEHFDYQFEDILDQTDISVLLNGPFQDWVKEKGSNKNKAPVIFAYDHKKLSVKVNGLPALDFNRSLDVGAKYAMSFRVRDFHKLLTVLAKQDCQSFRMRGDEGGLLEISWSDSVGRYAVYMPTVNLKGELETRRVAHMRVKSMQVAAE